MLTTLSGDELVQLREELENIKESFSLVEFDDEEVDEKKGNVTFLCHCNITEASASEDN